MVAQAPGAQSDSKEARAPVSVAAEVPDFAAVLAQLDKEIEAGRQQVQAQPGDWTRSERLAALLQRRFHLTSNLDDLVGAKAALDRAFRVAVKGGGPWAGRAALAGTLHDLPTTEEAHHRVLSRPLLSAVGRATALRGLSAAALARGEVDEARAKLDEARSWSDDFAQACAEARLSELTEGTLPADAHLETAAGRLRLDTGVSPAWVSLQRARLALNREDTDTATIHVEAAESALPGWWATDAARADILLAEGDRVAATEALRLASSATPHPEYAARLAVLVAETDLFAAEDQMAEARSRMAAWLLLSPTAMSTHAAQLALSEGDAHRGLQLARAHSETHADVDALVLLSRAATLAGEHELASQSMARVRSGPWDSGLVDRLCAAGACPQ